MSPASKPLSLDRYTEISSLGLAMSNAVKKTIVVFAISLACESAYLLFSGQPGAIALASMGAATCASLAVWSSGGKGLPLLPLMVLQNLLIYGLPIVAGHAILQQYPDRFLQQAGFEVLAMDIAMVLAWKLGMQTFSPSPPVSYALRELNRAGARGWARLGFVMTGFGTAGELLGNCGYLDSVYSQLPNGATSILNALYSVMSACGFFLISLAIGGGQASSFAKAVFWVLLIINGMAGSLDFILAGVAATLVTVAIGFFWSSGKFPWLYLTTSMLALSFLNSGKTTMRMRYWATEDTPAIQFTPAMLPAVYGEWVATSFDAVVENSTSPLPGPNKKAERAEKNQTLLDRIDNLQNLLFVIDAVDTEHVSLLHGKTYSLIPPLLVPRIIWPDKPRSHEGQVMLNVHFGRQDLDSTFSAYIAWGLLPEAYGNFGPLAGALFLGFFLGVLFAWIENFTARKLVISMEGFLSLSLLMNLMNSFEMVASVLVTALFQSFMIIIAASLPFVQRTVMRRRDPEAN